MPQMSNGSGNGSGSRSRVSLQAEERYINSDLSLQQISEVFNTPLRTVKRWSSKYNWPELRDARKSGALVPIRDNSRPSETDREPATTESPPKKVEAKPQPMPSNYQGIDYVATAEKAIRQGFEMADRAATKRLATWDGSMRVVLQFLEFHVKHSPRTPMAVLELAIASGIKPKDLHTAIMGLLDEVG
ncbi:MAG: hypothetical protein DDT26_00759 [Dehalococcoidia bacterium]|nr:hypothetical protein [Chloroflexota bacterium]